LNFDQYRCVIEGCGRQINYVVPQPLHKITSEKISELQGAGNIDEEFKLDPMDGLYRITPQLFDQASFC
jgi:hypothetical protein